MLRKDDIDGALTQLAFDYFYWFSRFEFCLKEHEFLRCESLGASAEPGWNRFIAKHSAGYELSVEAKALLAAPPDRQIVGENSTLDWKPLGFEDCSSELEMVVRSVKTVRNNLFHGGKHDAAGWDNPERMHFLIATSQAVLDSLVELGGFRGAYERRY